MKYELPNLPYPYDALEPHIDAKTMEIHHTKHHGGYVQKLNTALEKYPDFAEKAAREVSEKRVDYAILICASGIGMAIVANKFPGVRAGVIHDVESAKRSRQHNDLNVLCLSSLTNHRSVDVVRAWIHTPFEGGRHQKRIEKISMIEQATLNRHRGKK